MTPVTIVTYCPLNTASNPATTMVDKKLNEEGFDLKIYFSINFHIKIHYKHYKNLYKSFINLKK
jgi:hypothetical protein